MTSLEDTSAVEALLAPRRGPMLTRTLFTPGALLVEAWLVVLVAVAAGVLWHEAVYGTVGQLGDYLTYGSLVAVVFCGLGLFRGEYQLTRMMNAKRLGSRVLYAWAATFLMVLTVGFLTKSTEIYSRGAVVLFFATGLMAVLTSRYALHRLITLATDRGWVTARRVVLVGGEADLAAFERRIQPWSMGIDLVGGFTLREGEARAADLAHAVARARVIQPDDIMIVMPWSDPAAIEQAVDAFLTLPSALHLAPEEVIGRFDEATITKLGRMVSLELTRPALTAMERVLKRAFDIAAASVALVLLAPVFALVAALIKMDSAGPVFFLQRRYGFNQQPFRILKFRSMTTLDDGAVVQQATAGDARITRVGAFLRRTNIDELPQLVNVILGHMSLVGPRPHAVAHDIAFEQRIALYARRHNMKPGITGWAQVNGFRGETDTDEKMRGRVAHDLWYIDNWSLLLDLKICLMTVLSPRAFRNAR